MKRRSKRVPIYSPPFSKSTQYYTTDTVSTVSRSPKPPVNSPETKKFSTLLKFSLQQKAFHAILTDSGHYKIKYDLLELWERICFAQAKLECGSRGKERY